MAVRLIQRLQSPPPRTRHAGRPALRANGRCERPCACSRVYAEAVDTNPVSRIDGVGPRISAICVNSRGERTIVTYRDPRIRRRDPARPDGLGRERRPPSWPTIAMRNSCGRSARRRGATISRRCSIPTGRCSRCTRSRLSGLPFNIVLFEFFIKPVIFDFAPGDALLSCLLRDLSLRIADKFSNRIEDGKAVARRSGKAIATNVAPCGSSAMTSILVPPRSIPISFWTSARPPPGRSSARALAVGISGLMFQSYGGCAHS